MIHVDIARDPARGLYIVTAYGRTGKGDAVEYREVVNDDELLSVKHGPEWYLEKLKLYCIGKVQEIIDEGNSGS